MTGLDELLQQLFPKQQPTFRPTAIEGLLKPQQAEVKPYSPETFTGLLNDQPSVMRQAGLIGASFAPGAGFSDFAGTYPSAQGGTEPSAAQNLQQGNYLTSALQTLGAFGDAATATGAALGPLGLAAGMGVGSIAKTPRAVQKGVKGLIDSINPNAVDSVMSEFVPGVQAGQELIIHHNIPAEKLAKVKRVGGMPVPSLAISNVENPLTGFGEISLIGDPSMAVPSANNPFFPLDAYTKTSPKIDYNINRDSQKALESDFADISKKVPDSDYLLDRLVSNWEDHQYSDIMRAKFLDESGYGLPDRDMFPKDNDFLAEINKKTRGLGSEYEDWLQNYKETLPSKNINIEEKIFKGYTYSGKRRYVDVTLENLVKEMKGGAGTEGFNYGVGNLRAVATPKFRKLSEVKAARNKIIPQKEMSAVKDQVDWAYSSLLERIGKLENQSGYAYRPEAVLYEIGATRNVNKIDEFMKGAPDGLKADIGIFVNKLKELPTEYFEIKPQRAMQVSEFSGAIVPANTPKSSIDYLRSQGVNDIHYYSTPEERTSLFKKFGDKMFQIGAGAAGLGTAGLLATEEEQF